jgi:DNA-binding transcriptional regulator YdaS (Cro superfamily)
MATSAKIRKLLRGELGQIQVASPCHARWEAMEGDEKVRFCRACQLPVYNLSAMEPEEAARRLSQDDPRLCVRFYRRADGTILTQDCPVGAEAVRQGRRRAGRGTAAAAAVLGITAANILMPIQGARSRPASRAIALRSAAITGDVNVLRAMLDAGVDPNVRSSTGATPLMRAAELGHTEVVQLLLERGADVNARDRQGNSALKLARAARHPGVVALLRNAGAVE